MRTLQGLLVLTAAVLAAPELRAEQLRLHVQTTLDVSALNLRSVGDVAFERTAGRLWVSDGSTGGLVYEVSPTTGALLSSFDPGAVPGLDQGPEGLAVANGVINPPLSVFSSINENEGGRVSQGGSLLSDYGGGIGAMGADFDMDGNLWIVSGTALGAGSTLRRIDPTTGAVLFSLPIVGSTSRAVDVAFDPLTNQPYVLFEETGLIGDIDLVTGIVQTVSDVTSLLPHVRVGGFDFDLTGEFLYVAMGATAAESTSVTVLRRDFDRLSCSGGASCPCGNQDGSGGGCVNSFGTSAELDSRGVPSVAADTFRFEATGLPPTTSALLFQGTSLPTGGTQVFGDGLRCVAGNVIRLGVANSSAGVAHWPRASDPAIGVAGAIPAGGGARLYQVWYRNSAAFCTAGTFNLSNSIRVSWFP